jgi:hypothetical protein
MTHYEMLLAAAIIAGFALLLLTVGAFIIARQKLGLLLLITAGVAFVASLGLMSHVSHAQEVRLRHAVLAKYDVRIQKWGEPLGSNPTWVVNGQNTVCEADVSDESDPVLSCGQTKLPLR